MTDPSRIVDCFIIQSHKDETLKKPLFDFSVSDDGGLARVDLDGYLVCPRDMFSEQQIKAAMKKYRSRRTST